MKVNENGVVTTKDWLKATEGMRITAYDPAPTNIPSSDSATTVFTRTDFEDALRTVRSCITHSEPEN